MLTHVMALIPGIPKNAFPETDFLVLAGLGCPSWSLSMWCSSGLAGSQTGLFGLI